MSQNGKQSEWLPPCEILQREVGLWEPSLTHDRLKYLGKSGKVDRISDPENARNHLYDYLQIKDLRKELRGVPQYMRQANAILAYFADHGLPICRQTLSRWADKNLGCEILGRNFNTAPDPARLNHVLFDIRDAEAVAARVRSLRNDGALDVFEDERGLTWIWRDDAVALLNKAMKKARIKFTVCELTMSVFCREGEGGGCFAMDGRVFKQRDGWIYNPSADRAYRRPYILLNDVHALVGAVEAIHRATTSPVADKRNLTLPEVAREFPRFGGNLKAFLRRWSNRPHPRTGHKIHKTKEKRLSHAGRVRNRIVYSKEDLHELYGVLGLRPDPNRNGSPQPQNGRAWIGEVATDAGVSRHQVGYWIDKNCPYREGGAGTLDAEKQIRGVGHPPGKTVERAVIPAQVKAAVAEKNRCREVAKAGQSGVWRNPDDGTIYRSVYAARRTYRYLRRNDANRFLVNCRLGPVGCAAALGGERIDWRQEHVPDGPLGIPEPTYVYRDDHLKLLDEWLRARDRLKALKWDRSPDYQDAEGGWVTFGRFKEYGFNDTSPHSWAAHDGKPYWPCPHTGTPIRAKRATVPGSKRAAQWVYHMDDLAEAAAARDGKRPPKPRWPLPRPEDGAGFAAPRPSAGEVLRVCIEDIKTKTPMPVAGPAAGAYPPVSVRTANEEPAEQAVDANAGITLTDPPPGTDVSDWPNATTAGERKCVPTGTITRAINTGRLSPAYRRGRETVIDPDALRRWKPGKPAKERSQRGDAGSPAGAGQPWECQGCANRVVSPARPGKCEKCGGRFEIAFGKTP